METQGALIAKLVSQSMCSEGKISLNENLLGKQPPTLIVWRFLFCREFLMS